MEGYAQWKMTAAKIKFRGGGFLESDRLPWPLWLAVWRQAVLWRRMANSLAILGRTGARAIRGPQIMAWTHRTRILRGHPPPIPRAWFTPSNIRSLLRTSGLTKADGGGGGPVGE